MCGCSTTTGIRAAHEERWFSDDNPQNSQVAQIQDKALIDNQNLCHLRNLWIKLFMTDQSTNSDGLPDDRRRAGIGDLAADFAVVDLDLSRRSEEVDRELESIAEDLKQVRKLRGKQLQPSGWPVIVSIIGIDPITDEQRDRVRVRLAAVAADASSGPAFGDIEIVVLPQDEVAGAAASVGNVYRRRRAHADRRLRSVLCGVAAAIAALIIFAIVILALRSAWILSPLAARIEEYRGREGVTAAARLQEPLQGRMAVLADILADPAFPALSSRRQDFVRGRLTELSTYRDYTARLGRIASPLEARTEQELDDVERQLSTDLALPAAYADSWTTTEAALRRDQALTTARLMRENARVAADWYRRLAHRAQLLIAAPAPDRPEFGWPRWSDQVAELFAETKSPPVRTVSRAAFAAVMALPSVAQARADWERGQRRLQALSQMSQALGLAPGDPSPPLRLLADFTAVQTAGVVERLNAEYSGWRDWSPARWPESTASALRPALLALRDAVLDAGRRDLARRLAAAANGGTVSAAQWRAVSAEFAADPALRDWRELAAASTRWLEPEAPDPVTALTEFLARDRFDVELRSVRLTWPESIPGGPWTPAGDFVIRAQSGAAPPRSLTFRLAGDSIFLAESDRALTILPGDAVWAELPIRNRAGQAAILTWWANGVRTSAYQLDRLTRPPRIHRPDQAIENGPLLEGVRLMLTPDFGWPRLPDLLPAIR